MWGADVEAEGPLRLREEADADAELEPRLTKEGEADSGWDPKPDGVMGREGWEGNVGHSGGTFWRTS